MSLWDKNDKREVEKEVKKEESPWQDDRLKGPNSSIFTIILVPKWMAIQEKVLKPVADWKKFPDKLCREWIYRTTSDHVSGLFTQQAEYYYSESVPVEIYSDVDQMRFNIQTSEFDLDIGEFNSLVGQDMMGRLSIGFKMYETPDPNIDVDAALGIVDWGTVFEELKKMDSILLGAALERPIRLGTLSSKDTLKYNPAKNPRNGFHVFENEYFTVHVQLRSFRGIFTKIEDYGNHLAEELDVKYYGRKPLPNGVKDAQHLLEEVLYKTKENPWFDSQIKKEIQAELKKRSEEYPWMQNKFGEAKRKIEALEIETKEAVEYFYVCRSLYDLHEELDVIGNEDLVLGGLRFTPARKTPNAGGQIDESRAQHPSGDSLVIRTFKGEGLNNKVYVAEINGNPVLKVEFFMEYDFIGTAPLGFSYFEYKHIGTILECKPGKWYLLIHELLIEIRNQIGVQRITELLRKAEATTGSA